MKTKSFIKIFILITLITTCKQAFSQDYKNSISLNSGIGWGFSYKRLMEDNSSFGAALQFINYGVSFQGYRAFHTPLRIGNNFKWFLVHGYGGHFRNFSKYKRNYMDNRISYGNYTAIGIDGIIGIEHRLLKYPFTFGASYNPNFEFGGPNTFNIYYNMLTLNISITF